MATIKLITEKWLESKKAQIGFTADSANKAALEAEVAEAEKHLKAKNEVITLAAKLGYKRNEYTGKCKTTGSEVKPLQGFVKKNAIGRWETFSFATVQAEVGHPGVE